MRQPKSGDHSVDRVAIQFMESNSRLYSPTVMYSSVLFSCYSLCQRFLFLGSKAHKEANL